MEAKPGVFRTALSFLWFPQRLSRFLEQPSRMFCWCENNGSGLEVLESSTSVSWSIASLDIAWLPLGGRGMVFRLACMHEFNRLEPASELVLPRFSAPVALRRLFPYFLDLLNLLIIICLLDLVHVEWGWLVQPLPPNKLYASTVKIYRGQL